MGALQTRPTDAESSMDSSREADSLEHCGEGKSVAGGEKSYVVTPCLPIPSRLGSASPAAINVPTKLFKSPRSVASTPPSTARSKRSPKSVRSSNESLTGLSSKLAAGRCGMRQRGRAYVARAQECISRWRRERLETRTLHQKEAQDLARGGQSEKQRAAIVEPCGGLEVHGFAPASTPAKKKNVKPGSLAAARALYTPPGRRSAREKGSQR